MKQVRKRWSGVMIVPEAPDLVLSRAVEWTPDFQKKYSTLNGYEPNNLIAAAAWTNIPRDLIASDAFIYKDRKTKLWVQAVGYPLITRENYRDWIELQMSAGASQYWINQYAQPRLPLKPYTQIETPGKVIDQISYIEMINEQGKFIVNGIDLRDLNPRGRPKDIDVYAELPKRKTYEKRDTGVFHIRRNSKFLQTPKGVYASVSSAAADMGMTFCGLTYHIKRNSPGYGYITEDEYLIRSAVLNKNETTE